MTTLTNTTNYPQQEAHIHVSVSKQWSEPYILSQSRKLCSQTSCLFAMIRLLWKRDKERIERLKRTAIGMGRHPAIWKHASGMVICKPGEDDYQAEGLQLHIAA